MEEWTEAFGWAEPGQLFRVNGDIGGSTATVEGVFARDGIRLNMPYIREGSIVMLVRVLDLEKVVFNPGSKRAEMVREYSGPLWLVNEELACNKIRVDLLTPIGPKKNDV